MKDSPPAEIHGHSLWKRAVRLTARIIYFGGALLFVLMLVGVVVTSLLTGVSPADAFMRLLGIVLTDNPFSMLFGGALKVVAVVVVITDLYFRMGGNYKRVDVIPRPPASDIVFRLATMAVLCLLFYWYPVYHWSTYVDPDPRDGGALVFALFFCPISWIVGPIYYARAWRRDLEIRNRGLFRIVCTVLLLIILSSLVIAYRMIQIWLRD